MKEELHLPPDRERVRAVMRSDQLYALAATLPPERLTGRHSIYPAFMGIAYAAFISIYRSARKVARELSDPAVWQTIRDSVRERFPDKPETWLPAEPMQRHHWDYFKRQTCVETTLAALQDELLVQGANLTLEAGLMNPSGPGSFTNPHRDRIFYGDGKAIASLFLAKPGDFRVDPATGEKIFLRADPDASTQYELAEDDDRDPRDTVLKQWTRGTKFAFLLTRSELGRIIAGVAHVAPGNGGEAAAILEMMERLTPLTPGALALAYDRAWRGVHMQRLMTDMGLLSISRVVRSPRRPSPSGTLGELAAREVLLETRWTEVAPGRSELVKIYALDGTAGVKIPNVEGTLVFTALRLLRVIRNQNKSGKYRFYAHYELPPELGKGEITLRLAANEVDELAGLNRAEVFRAISPSHPTFDHLYSRRSDVESLNRGLEDSLFINRAHSVGWKGQLLDMIGFALSVNALTESRVRSRGQPILAA